MPRGYAGCKPAAARRADWSRSHPALKTELAIFAESEVTQYPYVLVNCPE